MSNEATPEPLSEPDHRNGTAPRATAVGSRPSDTDGMVPTDLKKRCHGAPVHSHICSPLPFAVSAPVTSKHFPLSCERSEPSDCQVHCCHCAPLQYQI